MLGRFAASGCSLLINMMNDNEGSDDSGDTDDGFADLFAEVDECFDKDISVMNEDLDSSTENVAASTPPTPQFE